MSILTNFYWGLRSDGNGNTLYLSSISTQNATNVFSEDFAVLEENAAPWRDGSQEHRIFTVIFENNISPTCTAGWFANLTSLENFINWNYLNVSNVTNMSHMFLGCEWNTFNPDFSNWDVSNVTDMSYIFAYCGGNSFNPNISNWNVSSVTNMEGMFIYCNGNSFNPNISNWDVSNVTNMEGMFEYCNGNAFTELNLNNWNVSNVTNMDLMFNECTNLETIYCRNTWTPTTSNYMFYNCTSLIGENETPYNANYITSTYARLDKPNSPGYFSYPFIYWGLSQDNTTLYLSGTKTENALYGFIDTDIISSATNPWYSYHSNITTVIFENKTFPTSTAYWFSDHNVLNIFNNWNNLNVSDVTNMRQMFYGCSGNSFNPDFSNWDVSSVIDMEDMFYGCRGNSFNPNVDNWNVSNVTSMFSMFDRCDGNSFNPNINNWNVSNVTNMKWMFIYCNGNSFNPNFSNWNVSKVRDMTAMFSGCNGDSFNPNFSNWDVSRVTKMSNMFYGCNQLLELNLKNWNTSNVTYMTNMFTNCTSLKKLVLGSNWKFRPDCGLSDPTEQEIPNQNGSKYSGKWIRTKDISDRSDLSSRGLSASELMSQYTGSTSMTGTYEWEILHPIYIKTKNTILNTYWNSDNHLVTIELPTSVPIELKECYSSQIAENSFNTYNYPIAQTQWIVDGQYPIEHISTDYTIARKAVTIEVDFNKGQFPYYPAAPDPLPQTVPENAIFKGWTTDFEHLYTDKDVWELEDLTLYAVYFVYKKFLEQKIRNPLEPSEWLTVDIFYQDDKGNVISQKELNKDENSLHLNYNILLQTDMATLNKVVQINFPLDDFAITVSEPSTEWTASDTQQQWKFGDNINNIDYLIPDVNNKIKKAQIRKAQLPTPTFPTPIAVSNTEPSDALIWIETN